MKKKYKLTLYSDNGAIVKRDIIISLDDRHLNPEVFYHDGLRSVPVSPSSIIDSNRPKIEKIQTAKSSSTCYT